MVLVSIEVEGGRLQIELVREILLEVSRFLEIRAISSVYQIHLQIKDKIGESKTGLADQKQSNHLCVVVKGMPLVSLSQLTQELRALGAEMATRPQQRRVDLYLLAADSKTSMDPELNLPMSFFYREPKLLVPAAEVWPDWVHPILKKELSELADASSGEPWGEFHSQGKALLDFQKQLT